MTVATVLILAACVLTLCIGYREWQDAKLQDRLRRSKGER